MKDPAIISAQALYSQALHEGASALVFNRAIDDKHAVQPRPNTINADHRDGILAALKAAGVFSSVVKSETIGAGTAVTVATIAPAWQVSENTTAATLEANLEAAIEAACV